MKFLPLFPLSLVAFPGEQVNLHIFEPRYRQLILECFETKQTFGIAPINKNDSLELGTEMQIDEISHTYPDGKMDIKTNAFSVFRIVNFHPIAEGKLYPAGDVEFIEDGMANTNLKLGEDVISAVRELYKMIGLQKEVPDYSPSVSIYALAHKIGMTINEEINLLAIQDEEERLEYVLGHLENMLPVVRRTEELKMKVQMNGHFKHIDPAEFNYFK